MSDTRFESEIVKSLERLDEILQKSQIQTGGQSKVNWKEGDVNEYDTETDTKWDDDIADNGTDYKSGKGKKSLNKAKPDDEEAYADDDDDDDDDMNKSQSEIQQPAQRGVEVSVFLNELTKSIAVYCNHLEDYVEKSLYQVHLENGEMSKAVAQNLSALSEVIEKSQDNITQYAEEPARGPLSMTDMNKSLQGSREPEISKSQVIDALLKGVEAGLVSPLEVIKCEQLGVQAVSQDVVKSLLA